MLTPLEIDAAIRAGLNGRGKQLIVACSAVVGFGEAFKPQTGSILPLGGFEVTFSLTTGRIALLAAAARRFYKPFVAAEVPEDLKRLAVIVDAEPQDPSIESGQPPKAIVASPIQQIVVKGGLRGDRVVRPTEFKAEPVEWRNVFGSTVRANRAHARFDVGEIRELPSGAIQVVLVTSAGERGCLVLPGDRKRVFER
jgi:hypothetical protein